MSPLKQQSQHGVVDDQPQVGMPRIRRTRGRRRKGGPWSGPVQLLGLVLGGAGGLAVALFILQIGFGVDPLGLWSDRSAVVQRPPAVPNRQTPRTTPKKKQPVKRPASTSPSADPRTEQRGRQDARKPIEPVTPKLPTTVPPSGPGKPRVPPSDPGLTPAVVTVTNMVAMPLTLEIVTGPTKKKATGTSLLPAYLQDATTWFYEKPRTKVANGVLDFSVVKSGRVYLLAHWQNQGDPSGGWLEDRLTKEQLLEQGWQDLGPCAWDKEVYLLTRSVQKGESYAIRTNKYWPPHLAIPVSAASSSKLPLKPVPKSQTTAPPSESEKSRVPPSVLLPPPATEDFHAKRAEVEALFAGELQQIESLKTLVEKQQTLSALADKAQRLARDPQADVALRSALFHWAFVWSKKAANSDLAVAVTQEWERTFQGVDGCALRTTAIEEWSELKMPASLRQDLLELTLREAEAAALADRWEQVGILYALAQKEYVRVIVKLRKAGERAAMMAVVAEQRDLRRRRDPLAAFVEALSELQEDESKGEANDVVGRYYAVVRGDWQQGLPYLARSAEGALQSAAVLDLAGAQDGAGQVAIGDRWWDLAETRTTREAQPEWAEFLQRAGHWYAQGQDRVSEAEQVRVAKRLAKIQASNRPAPPPTLELGLLAYYPFNGNAKDESGNGHDGKIEGPELTDDRHGKANSAYAFRGGRDVIRIADHELLRPGQITISGWSFRTVSRSGAFVSKTEFTNVNLPRGEQFQLEIDDSLAKFLIKRNSEGRPGNGWQRLKSIGEVALERWVMVTATWDGFSQKIYLDGSMQGKNDDAPHGNIDNVPGGELLLGSSWVPESGHFSGLIDDVRIYNRSLSAAEVKALYDYEKPATSQVISPAGVERGNEGFSPQTRK